MKKLLDLSLYFVTDRDLCGGEESLFKVIQSVLLGGVSVLQLREKSLGDREFVEWGRRVKETLKGKNVPLIVNDRLDVAQAISADGIHLGPQDFSVKTVRSLMGERFIVGLSVESLKEAEEAQKLDVDYLAVSPVFFTSTKENIASPFGLHGLKQVRQISKHPLVAIGGIHEKNLDSVLECGVDGVAVVSFLCTASSPRKRAEDLMKKIQKKKKNKSSKPSFPQIRKLSDGSEEEIIHLLRKKMSFSVSSELRGEEKKETFESFVLKAEGEDCAVINKNEKFSYLVSTDSFVENVHFLRGKTSPFNLAYKSLAVNLSDIAAMGGKPLFFFLSLSLPKDLGFDWLNSFAEGLRELSQAFQLELKGGDTTASLKDIFINLTVIGEIETQKIKLRSQARVGDAICVTGLLGEARGGLKSLLKEDFKTDEFKEFRTDEWKGNQAQGENFREYEKELIQKHFRPFPHVLEGIWLSKQVFVHSMMDLSDGLYMDLRKLIASSQCGAKIFLNQLPTSVSFQHFCQKYGLKEKEEALMGGEDYVLLFTVDPENLQKVQQDFFQTFHRPFFPVGLVLKEGFKFFYGDTEVKVKDKSFSHFH